MEKIIRKYRALSFKLTPQRLAILQFLNNNTEHPTAEDIFQNIRRKYPTMSFATVYNTVQALSDRGDVMEITIDPERKHFDPNTYPHHHIMCTSCKKVADVFADYSEALKLPSEVAASFEVTGNHVDFYGICAACMEKRGRKAT